jgi:hypothetical protein
MNKKIILFALVALVGLLTSLMIVSALPTGPKSMTETKSERWPTWEPTTDDALAGNVTEMNFNSSSITRTWQGYFGNITGIIVLGDSNNNTLYDWSVASPQGEVYAVRNAAVPTWTKVVCASQAELQAEDTNLTVNESVDQDAVNRTFVVLGSEDQTAKFGTDNLHHPLFYVANQTITADSCPLAVMYNSSGAPSPYFKEVLLSDGSANLIYTALIAHTLNPFAESDGFDQRTHDFEMIVGEDGHGTDTAVTTYWFYVELGG